MKGEILIVVFLSLLLLNSGINTKAYTSTIGIEEGDIVDIEYQLEVDGEMIDQGRYDFEISEEKLIVGFYLGVLGMVVGQEKSIAVPPEQGYTNPDHELYGKVLYFNVLIHEIVVNIRDDLVSENNNSSTVITSTSTFVSETSNNNGITDISDLVDSESVELTFNLLFGVFSVLLIVILRKR